MNEAPQKIYWVVSEDAKASGFEDKSYWTHVEGPMTKVVKRTISSETQEWLESANITIHHWYINAFGQLHAGFYSERDAAMFKMRFG